MGGIMAKRKAIPQSARDKVLVDAMHRCCLCPEHQEVIDLHHVVPISEGGPNTEDNLMAVCPTCHAKIHRIRNRYSADQLRMYKERWVQLCALGLPLDLRLAQAFDTSKPPPSEMPGVSVGDGQKHLRELLTAKRRRLNVLELQAAKYGIAAPPHVTIEIEDLRREIAELEARLGGAAG
jgi:hypothetical protein